MEYTDTYTLTGAHIYTQANTHTGPHTHAYSPAGQGQAKLYEHLCLSWAGQHEGEEGWERVAVGLLEVVLLRGAEGGGDCEAMKGKLVENHREKFKANTFFINLSLGDS